MTRGRPFEPGNKFGGGRPKGSRNKKIQLAHKIFEDNAPAIIATAINKSLEDPQMLRMLAGRIVPRQRDMPIRIGRLPMTTLEDLDKTSATILKQATAGKIALSDAQQVVDMINKRRLVLVARELEPRVSAIEHSQGESKS